MSTAGEQSIPANATTESPSASVLDAILEKLEETGPTRALGDTKAAVTAKSRDKDLITAFIDRVLKGHKIAPKSVQIAIDNQVAEIDHLISVQLNQILHHPRFQKLEAGWKGLRYLAAQSETSVMLQIQLLDVSKRELIDDFEKNDLQFESSELFRKVYKKRYNTWGASPFGALIGDYEFDNQPEDIGLIRNVAKVAAAAHAPFVAAAAPALLGLKSFTQLADVRDYAVATAGVDFAAWRSFRNSEDSRYVALTVPHILLRLPYGEGTKAVKGFNYKEGVTGPDHSKYLWGSAAYALGARITQAFSRTGWCTQIKGPKNGGLVENLPLHVFPSQKGIREAKCPTEVILADNEEKQLSDLGLIPLVHCVETDYAAFFGTQTCQAPKEYDKPQATASAALSAQLPYILVTSRFAHYLKAMMRDYIGTFMSRAECERILNEWITTYVTDDDFASAQTKAEKPLREARIEVKEIPGKPGQYTAIAWLRPHLMLEGLKVAMRLVTELPQPVQK
jgi:type VI secretion system protein ImpC